MNYGRRFTLGILTYSLIACQLPTQPTKSVNYSLCRGNAYCKEGTIERVIDGDTIKFYKNEFIDGRIFDGRVRLVLVSAPESNQEGGPEATAYLGYLCPVGSEALIDQDDEQKYDRFGRMVAVVWCGDIRSIYAIRSNERMITEGYATLYVSFCRITSAGKEDWAIALGCPP